MKKVFTLILALAIGFGLKAQTTLTQAADFTATDVHGNVIHLFDILDSGQAVLIDFFFTSCGPCQTATPKVVESYYAMGCNMHDVFYIEISDRDSDALCLNWVNNYGVEYPTISGAAGGSGISNTYHIGGFPTVILIMPNHEIAIQDLWPISNAQTIINQLEAHGIQQHDCNTPSYDPQITISIDDVTENSVTATFTPNEDCDSYYYLVATETEIMDWLDGAEDLAEVVQNHGDTETATITSTFNDLLPETNYTILALPVDPDGTFGEVVQETVTTFPQVIIYNPLVTISIDEVTENSITATFTPNEDCASYYYLCATEAEIIGWVAMGANFDEIIQEHGGTETATITNTFNDLLPDTEYKVLALPVDPNDNYGEVAQETVTTMTLITYDPQVEINIDEISDNSVTATFTPNADCASFYYLCATEAELTEWGASLGEDLVTIMIEHGDTETTTLTSTFNDLLPETEYHVIALPVDPDGNYGEPVNEIITTLPIPVVYDETLTFSMDTVNIVDNQYEINWITIFNNTAEVAKITNICDELGLLAFNIDGEEIYCNDQIEISIPQGESKELGFICNVVAKGIVSDVVTLTSNLPDASFVVMLEEPLSINDNEASASLFPNPANESVTLQGENLGMVNIFNILGQKVDEFETNGTELRINTTSYENGIYFVKAGEQTLKFVVRH